MLLATALLIIGLLLVVYSADRLVYAASILCRMIGIPPLIIGMTVVSIGTSLPEIIVSAAASLHGQTDLAIGTALGSNITNILLILGLAALLRPFTVHSDILRRELPLMLLVSLLASFVLYDGQLSRMDGLFLLVLALLWLLFTIKIARLAERQGSDSLTREQMAELPREGSLPVALLWLGVAMIVMPMATRMVVDNATVLANYFAISAHRRLNGGGDRHQPAGTGNDDCRGTKRGRRYRYREYYRRQYPEYRPGSRITRTDRPGSVRTGGLYARLHRDAVRQRDIRPAMLASQMATRSPGRCAAGRRFCGLVGDAVLGSIALR